MAFIEKGQEIDIEAIKAETRLSAEALTKNSQISFQERMTASF